MDLKENLNMDYERFARQFMIELEQNMHHEGIELQRQSVTKYNGVIKDGVSVKYPNSPVVPIVYLDDLYERLTDGYNVSEIAEKVAKNLEIQRISFPEIPVLTPASAKENLYCVLLNTEANKDILRNVPHEALEDLSVVARFKVGNDGSFLVTHDICTALHMTSDEVMEAAYANTARQGYTCQPLSEAIRNTLIQEGIPKDYVDEFIDMQGAQLPIQVLSNSSTDGASVITSQEILKEVYEKLGEDYYILPSSRHEVLVISGSLATDVEELKTIVHETNAMAVSQIDKLSDNVYYFDGKKLSITDTLMKTQNAKQGLPQKQIRCH